jgi:hypothetical protein
MENTSPTRKAVKSYIGGVAASGKKNIAKPVAMKNGGKMMLLAETGFFCRRIRTKITSVAMMSGTSMPSAVDDSICMEESLQ